MGTGMDIDLSLDSGVRGRPCTLFITVISHSGQIFHLSIYLLVLQYLDFNIAYP